MDADSPPPLPEPVVHAPRPWGFWATCGLGAAIAIAFVIAQSLAMVGYLVASGKFRTFRVTEMEALTHDGVMVAVVTLVSAPIVIGMCVLCAWFRKPYPLAEYFALRWPARKVVIRWTLAFIAFIVVGDVITEMVGAERTERFMRDMWESSAPARPFLWVALLVAAPLSEEFFFRGFLFTGLSNSKLGGYGAIILIATLFALIHLQYDLQGLIFVFGAGIFFGLVRMKTGSLWLCIALHAFMNFIATAMLLLPE